MNYTVVWSKALLYSLCYIKGVCRQIDRAVNAKATAIGGITADCENSCQDAYAHTQKVITLIERKKLAIKLLHICGRVFDNMSAACKKALILRYFENKDYLQTAQILNCSVRTFFRHIKQGIKSFTNIRKNLGLSDEYLEDLYKGEEWVTRQKIKAIMEEESKQKAVMTKQLSA